jgi:hypothetical protein
MWIIRGLLLGFGLFVMGTLVFLKFTVFSPTAHSAATGLSAIQAYTTQNPFFWAALVACLVLGVSIIGSWPVPVRFPS